MAWLTRGDDVLAAVDLAWSRQPEGPMVVRRPRLLRCRVPLDVAWCAETPDGLEVRAVGRLRPSRVALPRPRCPVVVAAPAGAFDRWRLQVGDGLSVTSEPELP